MATIKSYSDLQQSKKLVEILPLESADMYYEDDISVEFGHGWHPQHIPCWSLAALLELITKVQQDGVLFNLTYDFILNKWTMTIEADNWKNDVGLYDNPVDACVAMIEKLNELKML